MTSFSTFPFKDRKLTNSKRMLGLEVTNSKPILGLEFLIQEV